MKILLILLILSTNAFAALTVGNVPKVKTGGSAPSMQDSSISEIAGNVGISSTIPESKLTITGISGTMMRVQRGGNISIYGGLQDQAVYLNGGTVLQASAGNTTLSSGASDIIFSPASVDKMRIMSSGNVGIGTTTAATLLHVGNSGTANIPDGAGVNMTAKIQSSSLTGTAGISAVVLDGTFNRRMGMFVDNTNSIVGLSSAYSSTAPAFVYRDGTAERLRIDANGNVGIGTSDTVYGSPSLVVKSSGAVRLEYPGTRQGIQLTPGTNSSFIAASQTTSDDLNFQAGRDLIFQTHDLTVQRHRMSINGRSGNVGIGTLSPAGAATARLHVVQSDAADAFRVDDQDAGDTTPVIIDQNGNMGIGTVRPDSKFVVNGGVTGAGYLFPYDLYGSATSGVWGRISNINTTGYSALTLAELTQGSSTPFFIARYGSASTTPNRVEVWNAQNGEMAFATNNVQRMTILGGGNVGIGSINPRQLLEIKGGSLLVDNSSTSVSLTNQTASGERLAGGLLTSGQGSVSGSSNLMIAPRDGVTAGTMLMYYYDGTTYKSALEYSNVASGATNIALLKSGGNVGIGSVNPIQALDVNGAIRSSSSGNSTFSGNVGIGTTVPTAAFVVGSNGHILSQASSSPTLSACGTSPTVTTGSTDSVGEITVGTGTITSCTVTFVTAWDRAPHCFIQGNTTSNKTYALTNTTTTFVITSGSAFDSEVLDYLCIGN